PGWSEGRNPRPGARAAEQLRPRSRPVLREGEGLVVAARAGEVVGPRRAAAEEAHLDAPREAAEGAAGRGRHLLQLGDVAAGERRAHQARPAAREVVDAA